MINKNNGHIKVSDSLELIPKLINRGNNRRKAHSRILIHIWNKRSEKSE